MTEDFHHSSRKGATTTAAEPCLKSVKVKHLLGASKSQVYTKYSGWMVIPCQEFSQTVSCGYVHLWVGWAEGGIENQVSVFCYHCRNINYVLITG